MTTVAQSLLQAAGRVPRSEARLLLAAAIGKPKEFLIAHPEYALTDAQSSLFVSYLKRAQTGEPIPYIVGVQEFWGAPLSRHTCHAHSASGHRNAHRRGTLFSQRP